MLQGQVPRSLSNCDELEVLDIGDNQFNGTFPYWLENLSELRVLVMRSNNFGGHIGQLSHVDSPFPNRHVFDISFNAFRGKLPLRYILHSKAMMIAENNSDLSYLSFQAKTSGYYYQDTVAIAYKGLYLEMPGILNTLVTIDLSNNNFQGKIPEALGNLKALRVLNLSRNSLTGQIPFSLGNLSELESFDVSRNKLSGEIPRQLISLTFLSVLNLSYNNLIGSIPQRSQFDTFSNATYEGNAGLCGLPLSRKCEIPDGDLPPTSTFQQNEDSTHLFDLKFAVVGYCSGLIVGLIIGQQLFWRGRIPPQISQLTELVSLDLSSNHFEGQIPSEISLLLTKLVFLDLSENSDLEIPNLRALLFVHHQNLSSSSLRELHLDGVNLSAPKNRDWCHHLSSALPNLRVLSMIDCSLTGPLDASISSLRLLSELYLDLNQDLTSTVPSSLANLTSLTVLSLYHCGFHGDFPSNVFLQPNLTLIHLSRNPLLSVQLPEFPEVNNNSLQFLGASGTNFLTGGKFPSSVGNLKFLKILYLNDCNFSGPIPPSLENLTHLTELELVGNRIHGSIPKWIWQKNLSVLHLSENSLTGLELPLPINNHSFVLDVLLLDSNMIQEECISTTSCFTPQTFNESNNSEFVSPILGNLTSLLSKASIFTISDNYLTGKIPLSICNATTLEDVVLSNNQLSGTIPTCLSSSNLGVLQFTNNKLAGNIPISICNASNLDILDFSNNLLSGTIPACLSSSNLLGDKFQDQWLTARNWRC
ncbi:receptor-like protein 35 [Telopea speciosissima]|uniref:receptor-like protein 35 n=1 Tax=Telopea speciosissima TaxID=54955 RepID=UPI001CC3F0DE|nr:receptor-like protein 35 [Telopea speciosissima]